MIANEMTRPVRNMEHDLRSLVVIAAAGIVVAAGVASGQGLPPRPKFDVASVKLVTSREPGVPPNGRMQGGPGTSSPGRITYTNVGLLRLVERAWGLPPHQIVRPSWMGGEPAYTVIATMPPETTEPQFKLMLQDLIADRFKMKVHYEDRNSTGYDLVVAPGGSKLKESADQDAPDPTSGPRGGVDKDGFALLPPGRGAGLVLANGMRAKFQNYTISELAGGTYLRLFAVNAGEPFSGPIRDKTGLTAKYDFTLAFEWRPSAVVTAAGPTVTGASDGPAAATPSGLPNIFGALEKQLGLKLIPVKNIPIKVLVIDRAEKAPTED